jgi:hypothetical protein
MVWEKINPKNTIVLLNEGGFRPRWLFAAPSIQKLVRISFTPSPHWYATRGLGGERELKGMGAAEVVPLGIAAAGALNVAAFAFVCCRLSACARGATTAKGWREP